MKKKKFKRDDIKVGVSMLNSNNKIITITATLDDRIVLVTSTHWRGKSFKYYKTSILRALNNNVYKIVDYKKIQLYEIY